MYAYISIDQADRQSLSGYLVKHLFCRTFSQLLFRFRRCPFCFPGQQLRHLVIVRHYRIAGQGIPDRAAGWKMKMTGSAPTVKWG
jgi:hypothetical protein